MDKWVVYILLAVCLSSCGQASGNKQVKQGTDSLQNDTVVSHSVDSLAYAYLKSGRIMYENGDKLGAIAKYNKAIEIDPLYMLAYYNRGLSKSKIGDNQGAIDDYSKAIQINPQYFKLNNSVSILHQRYPAAFQFPFRFPSVLFRQSSVKGYLTASFVLLPKYKTKSRKYSDYRILFF